MDKLLID
jgi:hypothetical protein